VRIVALLGPFGLLPDGLWIVYMLAIPGTFIWFALLGATVLGRPAEAPIQAAAPALTRA
jgi:hypothetical protein